jgi:hypothetical protein
MQNLGRLRGAFRSAQCSSLAPSTRCQCLHRPVARRRAATAAATPAAVLHERADAEFEAAYEALASLVTPPDTAAGVLRAGATLRGRGLIATQAIAAGDPALSVEAWNTLVVSDVPSGPNGGAYGAAMLDDWQAVHGALPPLLAAYLLSGVQPLECLQMGPSRQPVGPAIARVGPRLAHKLACPVQGLKLLRP